MLWSWWSRFSHWYPVHPVSFPVSSGQWLQLLLVSLSSSWSTTFPAFWQDPRIFPAIHPLFSKPQRILSMICSRTNSGLYVYYFSVWSKFSILYNSQWILFPIHLYLLLYSFCASFLHALIVWLTLSYWIPHILQLLFSWVLSILALKLFLWDYFVLLLRDIKFLALDCPFVAMRNSCAISLVFCMKNLYSRFSFHPCFLGF